MAFSTTPRTSIAGLVTATFRYRDHSPGEHTTLTIPLSSSRFRKVTPPAVAGRCRWVTAPPTSTRVPDSTSDNPPVGSAPSPVRCSRTNWTG